VRHCAHLIVACGITRVVCDKKYHDAAESEEIFKNAGIELVYLHKEVEKY
jgi:dCMP deaminase